MDITGKIAASRVVLRAARRAFGDRAALMWTGGKDSTLVLALTRLEFGEIPWPVLFVDTGVQFPETYEFISQVSREWGFEVTRAPRPVEEVKPGDAIDVTELDSWWEDEYRKSGLPLTFRVGVDREPCCHLLKTLALKKAILDMELKAVITGIRWDESPARAREIHFSPREDPPHTRVHPLLHFTWTDVLKVTKILGVPMNPLYQKGYTSIGCAPCTKPNPTPEIERAGRAQDKEEIMARLRALGYF